jgi:hypothetical protein
MAFNQQELEIIKFGKEQGKTRQQVEEALFNYRNGIVKQPATQTFGQEAMSDIKETGSALKNTLFSTADKVQGIAQMERTGEQGKATGFLKKIGTTLGGISQGIGDVFMGAGKAILPQSVEEKVKTGVISGVEKALPILNELDKMVGSPVGTRIEAYNNLDEKDRATVDAFLGAGMFGADIAGLGLGGKAISRTAKTGGEILEQVGKKTVGAVEGLTGKTIDLATDVVPKVSQAISPKPPALKAIGEVLQGKSKDIKSGIKALAELDTTGVKTFKELGSKINSRITELANVVDTDLAVDTVGKKLKDLVLTAKTTGGAVVKLNPVKNALNQLYELYTKIGDVVEKANIKEIITKATKEGLTPLEINNLARIYGQEFGEKAFSKAGEALTSVNAKMYENTRKALKSLARQGIKGDAAKMADEAMSALYNTQTLVKKNIEAVNKMTQKIRERGLFEKIGASLSKYGDVLTGGSLRGFIGGMLPRGAGYKVMNALDIEELLEKNLKIIQDAIKSGSDKDIINILKKLEVKPDKSSFNSPSVGKTAETKLYHATPEKFEDFDLGKTEGGVVWFTDNPKEITTNVVGAVQGKGQKLNTMERIAPKEMKWATSEMQDKFYTDELIRQGYDGVKIPSPEGEGNWYKVFDPNKSLKKPVSNSVSDPLIQEAKKYKSAEELLNVLPTAKIKTGSVYPNSLDVTFPEGGGIEYQELPDKIIIRAVSNGSNPSGTATNVSSGIATKAVRSLLETARKMGKDVEVTGIHNYSYWKKIGFPPTEDFKSTLTNSQLTDIWNKANR